MTAGTRFSRTRFSRSDAFISLLAIASVAITITLVTTFRPHDNLGIRREAYAQEPYRFPSGAAEKCVELWFHPPPDYPGEEVVALCDALLLKISDYIKRRDDLIPPLMELAVGKGERFENKTEEARKEMEEARIFRTVLVMTEWSSK